MATQPSHKWIAACLAMGWDSRGSTITIFALAVPSLLLCVAGATEIAEVVRTKTSLQKNVDSTALMGARQFSVDRGATTGERVRKLADDLADPFRTRWSVATAVHTDVLANSVTVTQRASRPSFFGSLLPPGGFNIEVKATGVLSAGKPLCVLALQTNGANVLSLQDRAVMTAEQCLVQSDSDLVVSGNAMVRAGAVRSVAAATGAIYPAPTTDAPVYPDPFASLPIHVPGTCNDHGVEVEHGVRSLDPGVHCGDIQIHSNGKLILNPGDHYFRNGQFSLRGNAELVGNDVALIFHGQTQMEFRGNASMSLDGRKSGPYAGFVLIADRSFTGQLGISATRARRLHGTIYLPNATFAVTGSGNRVADQSPWTVVIARRLAVSGTANLFINSSYSVSPVPVPSGVGANGPVMLMQ